MAFYLQKEKLCNTCHKLMQINVVLKAFYLMWKGRLEGDI